MPDGVQQVSFAKANAAIEEERIIDTTWIFGYSQRGGMGQLIRFTHNKRAKGITRIQQPFSPKRQ